MQKQQYKEQLEKELADLYEQKKHKVRKFSRLSRLYQDNEERAKQQRIMEQNMKIKSKLEEVRGSQVLNHGALDSKVNKVRYLK